MPKISIDDVLALGRVEESLIEWLEGQQKDGLSPIVTIFLERMIRHTRELKAFLESPFAPGMSEPLADWKINEISRISKKPWE